MTPFDHDDFDPEFPDEPIDPRIQWLNSPILKRRDTLTLIEQRRDLDGRGVNLFRTGLSGTPRSGLIDHYIEPHLIFPGAYYIYMTPEPGLFKYGNWHPEITRRTRN